MATNPDSSEHLLDSISPSPMEGGFSEDLLRRLARDLEELESEQPSRRRRLIVGSIAFVIVLTAASIVFYLLR